MGRHTTIAALALSLLMGIPGAGDAQVTGATPTVIPLSGALQMADGQPRTGGVILAIALYEQQQDVAPRWVEHQAVTLDATGRYEVVFGSTRPEGLPVELFGGATPARWVGVAVQNEPEQPRVMLVSVPYSAKAATADTLAGRSIDDFVLTEKLTDGIREALRDPAVREELQAADDPEVGTEATANVIPKFTDGSGTLADSAVAEVDGRVGIGTTNPGLTLHVVRDFPADGNTIRDVMLFDRMHSAGAGANGIGARLSFRAESTLNGSIATMGRIGGVLTDASTGTGALAFETTLNSAAFERMRIAGNGNVGIGTASPTSRLHVAGDAAVTGNVVVDGTIASPTIAALAAQVSALTARVSQLESGAIVEADVPGTYAMQFLGLELLGGPARVGMENGAGLVTLDADGNGTFTATNYGFCQLLQGTTWSVDCQLDTGTESVTWRLEDGKLIITDDEGEEMPGILAAGGRVMIFGGIAEVLPGGGFSNIGIAVKLPQ